MNDICVGNIHIVVLIHCNTSRIEKLVMGKRGWRIKDIAKKSEQHLRDVFMTDVFLKLVVTDKLKGPALEPVVDLPNC